MINAVINGCGGKMGHVVARLASQDSEINITAGFDIADCKDFDFPVYTNYDNLKEKADVIIDFSHPDCIDGLLSYCKKNKIPAVICTTGLSNRQKNELEAAAEEIPVFFSANMSLGINLIISLAKQAVKLLEDSFDIEIIEKHHNQKIDAPSGTALAIADAVSGEMKKQAEYVYDRHTQRIKRKPNEIGIHSVRGGTIVGEHSVIFAGNDEVIELKHSAASKEVFAVGAIKAAKFLVGKKPGMYDMNDLISSLELV